MEKKFALLLGVLLLLPVAHFFGAALQVKASETTDSDPKISLGSGNEGNSNDGNNGSISIVNHGKDDKVRKGKDQVGKNGLDKTKPSGKNNLRKDQNELKGKGVSDHENDKTDEMVGPKDVPQKKEGRDKDGIKSRQEKSDKVNHIEKGNGLSSDEEKKKPDDLVGTRKMPEEEGDQRKTDGLKGEGANDRIEGDFSRQTGVGKDENSQNGGSSDDMNEKKGAGVGLEKVPKDGSSSDECYFSIKCTDNENNLIACLRVPGNESPHLSLLIQNKGNNSLTVDISAPDFVQLERNKVQLREKENSKVEVSIGNGGTESLIVLTAGSGVCNLDFKDLIAQNSVYLNLPARRPTIAFLSFSALLILVSAWLFVSFRRRKLVSISGFAYQKLDAGLPVFGVGKQRLNSNDVWDESWGDDWNDEEAPRTPSKPSLSLSSSKRLASRRLSKESRKD